MPMEATWVRKKNIYDCGRKYSKKSMNSSTGYGPI
jgi:hypothetical protein